MPAAPPAIFAPPSAGSPPAAAGAIFLPAAGGGTPAAPGAVFTPPAVADGFLYLTTSFGGNRDLRFRLPEEDGPLAVRYVVPSNGNNPAPFSTSYTLGLLTVNLALAGSPGAAVPATTASQLADAVISSLPFGVDLVIDLAAGSNGSGILGAMAYTALTSTPSLVDPPAIFSPPSSGSAPAAAGGIFTPPDAGTPPDAAGAIFAPPDSETPAAAPGAIFTPPIDGGTPSAPPPIFGMPLNAIYNSNYAPLLNTNDAILTNTDA
jgi:hypothetical protein